jgi:branched-subunit amino acid ABC-type transport system permease component
MILQFVVNGIMTAGPIALIGISLALIIQAQGFMNLSVAAIITLGAYFSYWLYVLLGLPLVISCAVSMLFCGFAGSIFERVLFHRLRIRHATSAILLLASLGLYVVLQALIEMAFGADILVLSRIAHCSSLTAFGAFLKPIQIWTLGIALSVAAGLAHLLSRTRWGIGLRALAEDAELSRASGIRSTKIRSQTSFVACGIAAVSGIMVGLDVDLLPAFGMHLFFGGLVVALIGRSAGSWGIVVAALFLGLSQQLSVWLIDSRWQDGVAFLILLIALLVNPSLLHLSSNPESRG